jgi:hypothetical protein
VIRLRLAEVESARLACGDPDPQCRSVVSECAPRVEVLKAVSPPHALTDASADARRLSVDLRPWHVVHGADWRAAAPKRVAEVLAG